MIIGYKYEADIHCLACSILRFATPDSIIAKEGVDEHGIPDSPAPKDKEGNEIQPMFPDEEHGFYEECEYPCEYTGTDSLHYYPPVCGDCCIEL